MVLAYKYVDASIKGDTNNDGKISSIDYIAVRKHLLKENTLSGGALLRSDANGDNRITTTDYIVIRKMILKNDTSVSS